MREIKFRAWVEKYNQMYWFDVMWGNKHATGSGWVGMLPIIETEREYGLNRDNRVDVDPNGNYILVRPCYSGRRAK